MKPTKHNVNTGKLLNDHFKRHYVNRTELGYKIGRDNQSITKYGQNTSIQTAILVDISYALEHNFFQDIANTMPDTFTVNRELNAGMLKVIDDLREENKVLRIQNELLMKIRG